MKNIIYLIFLIGFSGFSQIDTLAKKDYERVYIEVGFTKPLGKMGDKFETSPSIGFWFRNKIVKEDYVDFGFNLFFPNNAKDIDFNFRDSIVKYESNHFGILIGTRFSKGVCLSNQTRNFNLEWNSGIGLALNFYEAPNELIFEEKEDTQEVLTTFYLSQGIKLNYKNVGFQCHYSFIPYDLFNEKINEKYGSQNLMFGIVYRQ